MSEKNYKYIYGPVPSWRLGSSLGVDPLSKGKKVCTFDCVYCQIGKTKLLTDKRETFVKVGDIVEELDSLPYLEIDYITFSGAGEPTIAKNLGQMIKALKRIRNEKIAVITNSSLMHREDVQEDLSRADFVVAKFDASRQDVFELVNQPINTVRFDTIFTALKDFRSRYLGKLALQVMFVEQNKNYAKEIAQIAKEIKPDEVQLNTPLRPCKIKPLAKSEMDTIEKCFSGFNTVSVYNAEKKGVKSISSEDTLKRRGKV